MTTTTTTTPATAAEPLAEPGRADLIVIDDIGMLPAGQDAAEAFDRIVDAACERRRRNRGTPLGRRSIAVTSDRRAAGTCVDL